MASLDSRRPSPRGARPGPRASVSRRPSSSQAPGPDSKPETCFANRPATGVSSSFCPVCSTGRAASRSLDEKAKSASSTDFCELGPSHPDRRRRGEDEADLTRSSSSRGRQGVRGEIDDASSGGRKHRRRRERVHGVVGRSRRTCRWAGTRRRSSLSGTRTWRDARARIADGCARRREAQEFVDRVLLPVPQRAMPPVGVGSEPGTAMQACRTAPRSSRCSRPRPVASRDVRQPWPSPMYVPVALSRRPV
jgi:hypothetical protein